MDLTEERLAEIEADGYGSIAETLVLVAEVRRRRAVEFDRRVEHNCAGPCPCMECREAQIRDVLGARNSESLLGAAQRVVGEAEASLEAALRRADKLFADLAASEVAARALRDRIGEEQSLRIDAEVKRDSAVRGRENLEIESRGLDVLHTSALHRAAWLERRRAGLGGSDVAAVVGLNPWSSPLQVYAEKRGLVEPKEMSEAMRWGHVLEPVIAQEYARRLDVEVYQPSVSPIVHPSRSWQLGTPDALVRGAPAKGVECKAVGYRMRDEWGEDGSDEVPGYYLAQAAWYGSLLDAEAWDVATLIGGQDIRLYRVARSPALEAFLLEEAERFWRNHVLAGEPPPPRAQDARILEKLFARPTTKDLATAAPELEPIASRLAALRMTLADLEDEKDDLEIRIKHSIGDRPGVRGTGWTARWSPTPETVVRSFTRPAGRRFTFTPAKDA